jgi:hypothetical protein
MRHTAAPSSGTCTAFPFLDPREVVCSCVAVDGIRYSPGGRVFRYLLSSCRYAQGPGRSWLAIFVDIVRLRLEVLAALVQTPRPWDEAKIRDL